MAYDTVARPRDDGGTALPDWAHAGDPGAGPHILHILPGFGVGGIQVRLARVVNSLGGRFRHTILSLNGDFSCRDRLDPGGDTVLATNGVSGNFFHRLRCYARRITETGPNLLATYNWGAIEWAMANRLFARVRHIHFEDGFGPDEAERPLYRRALFRRWALASAEAVIVPSRNLERIAHETWRLHPGQVRYVPNGIAADAFAAPEAAPLFVRRPGESIIGTVAPLRPEKNLSRLIEAFAALAGSPHLVIAGGGPERAKLEARAGELNVAGRVTFLGAVSDPHAAMAGFDVFALSSDTEQMPMTVLEAMATGLPVAATDVGDVKLMVAPENREYIVSKDDTASLTAALARLIADPARAREVGRRNRAEARSRFPWGRMVETYAALYEGGR